ncbi:glycosyl transferase [Vibrio splendidus]|uniref:glycosyltransferase n=1 Tax=Vibrio splendidus TaxID=29497 RepID=UPI000D37A6C0|nr:glycosyltransferase [Vibrio splendidus]PTP86652.1 glycosyl transferase [Vibrio splendidus]
MKKVCVLLAAYNGERFISEQIDSILKQEDVDIDIFISLDKSEDTSMKLLLDISSNYSNIKILPYGDRFGGAAPNFYRLILEAPIHEYDYVSLADQDDIWLPKKISSAIHEMERSKCDGYSSNVTAFWSDGRTSLVKKSEPQVEFDFLFESAGPGCTFVLSNDLCRDFKKCLGDNIENLKIEYHDWFIYAFARLNGYKWLISNESNMMYRQHESNQIGANSGLKSIVKRFSLIRSGWYREQIKLIIKSTPKSHVAIYPYIFEGGYREKLKLAFNFRKLRRNKKESYWLMLMIVLGCF